jgi:hypothetical protein
MSPFGRVKLHEALNRNPLDFIEGDLIIGAVVQLRSARRLVGSDGLGVFYRTAVFQIGGDAGRPKCVAAGRIGEAGGGGAALYHPQCIGASAAQSELPGGGKEEELPVSFVLKNTTSAVRYFCFNLRALRHVKIDEPYPTTVSFIKYKTSLFEDRGIKGSRNKAIFTATS